MTPTHRMKGYLNRSADKYIQGMLAYKQAAATELLVTVCYPPNCSISNQTRGEESQFVFPQRVLQHLCFFVFHLQERNKNQGLPFIHQMPGFISINYHRARYSIKRIQCSPSHFTHLLSPRSFYTFTQLLTLLI